MDNQNKHDLPKVSMDVFAQVLIRSPKGKSPACPICFAFLKRTTERWSIWIFLLIWKTPRWEQLPWWCIVGEEGELLDGLQGLMEQQFKFLDTYVINEDQAETVRMIFDMYLHEDIGTGKIAQRLTELGRLNASGLNKWSHAVIARILNNQTYMGVIAYGKSFSNNYLEQKRINNRDKSTYMCVEGNFPAIVSQEEWYKVQEIKAGRMMESFNPQTGKKVRHSMPQKRDLWGTRLHCSCGCSFRRNRWHRNTNAPDSYGYQCYNILNNGSGKQRREAGADDTGYCDQPMIADWKLELMGKAILEQIFGQQQDLFQYTMELIRQYDRSQSPRESNLANSHGWMEQVKARKERLLDMRTGGELTKEEFLAQRQKLDAELQRLTKKAESIDFDRPQWSKIEEALKEILDLSQPKPNPDLIRKFVTRIVPDGKSKFRWYLNLDGENTTIQDMVVSGGWRRHNTFHFSGCFVWWLPTI